MHLLVLSLLITAACAGSTYLPREPGGAQSDVSGLDIREAWVADHPETAEGIREAVREGVFLQGMTIEHRDVITNPARKGSTGNGYWRSRLTGDEMRYQWFIAGQREPFVDGRGRLVCELVFVGSFLTEVGYCGPAAEGASAASP